MHTKFELLASFSAGVFMLFTTNSDVLANSSEQLNSGQVHQKKLHHFILKRLDKLEHRLKIQTSQQDAWGKYAKSVEAMAERKIEMPERNADAASISRFRADKALEFANGLAKVAEATAQLQSVLTEEQRATLNQAARRLLQQDIKRKRENIRQLYKQKESKQKETLH